MAGRRRSMLDNTRNNNFLRKSFGSSGQSSIIISREDYLLALGRERRQWKELYREKQKSLTKNMPELIIKREDIFLVKNDDIAFRDSKPKYLEITQNARFFIQRAQYHNQLALEFNRRSEHLLNHIDEKRDDIITQLFAEEMQLCQVCDNDFCTKEVHPLIGKAHFTDVISDLISLQLEDVSQ